MKIPAISYYAGVLGACFECAERVFLFVVTATSLLELGDCRQLEWEYAEIEGWYWGDVRTRFRETRVCLVHSEPGPRSLKSIRTVLGLLESAGFNVGPPLQQGAHLSLLPANFAKGT